MKMKKLLCSLLSIAIILSSAVTVFASDNETDPIPLKKEVVLTLSYSEEYTVGSITGVPTTASYVVVDEQDQGLTMNASDCDILYTGVGNTYSSSNFPSDEGNYKVTWTVKESNADYYGSGEDTFALIEDTEYTITYTLNGGKNATSNPSTFTKNTNDITLQDATKKGSIFRGWYSEATFVNKITKIAKGTTENVSLFAKWTKLGDVNESGGNIDGTDILLLRNYYLSKITVDKLYAPATDINSDGKFDGADIIMQRNIYLGAYSFEE